MLEAFKDEHLHTTLLLTEDYLSVHNGYSRSCDPETGHWWLLFSPKIFLKCHLEDRKKKYLDRQRMKPTRISQLHQGSWLVHHKEPNDNQRQFKQLPYTSISMQLLFIFHWPRSIYKLLFTVVGFRELFYVLYSACFNFTVEFECRWGQLIQILALITNVEAI